MGKRKTKRLRQKQKQASALRSEQNRRASETPVWEWAPPADPAETFVREIPSFLESEQTSIGEEVPMPEPVECVAETQEPVSEPPPTIRMPAARPQLDAWPKRRGHIHVVITAGLFPDELDSLKHILQANQNANEAQTLETASVRRDLMASFNRTPDYWVLPPGHTLHDRREEGVQCWIACEDPEELFEAHLGRFAEHPDVDKIRFLLFYQNAAHYIGTQLTQDIAPEQAAQQWLERSQTLLDFQARYPAESILLESTRALQNPFDLRDAAYRLNLPIDTQRNAVKPITEPERALAAALATDWVKQHPAIAQMSALLNESAVPVRGQLQLAPSNHAIQDYRALKTQIRKTIQEKTKLQSDLDAQLKKIQEEKNSLNQQVQAEQGKAAELNKALSEEKKKQDALSQQKTELETTQATKLKDLTEENDLLLAQLHQVQEELERYYLENQEYKQKYPPLYGATERVKNTLEYRIGKALIDHSRSLKGLLTLRGAIKRIRKEVAAEEQQRSDKPLPPIEDYLDAADAERTQKHLSYRLGTTWVQSKGSPLRWLKLPFALRSNVRAFRTETNAR